MKILTSIFIIILNLSIAVANTSNDDDFIYTLKNGEEFVFGKTGLDNEGYLKYTFVIIRKKNEHKTVYYDTWKHYDMMGSFIQGSPVLRKSTNPKNYQKYDYWVIFNGKKMGPYDSIYDIEQMNPNIDDWVSKDGNSISFSGQIGKQYIGVIHNKPVRKFWTNNSAPKIDYKNKNDYYSSHIRKKYFIGKNKELKSDNWKSVHNLKYANNSIFFIGKKNNEYNIYKNNQRIYGPIAYKYNKRRILYDNYHARLKFYFEESFVSNKGEYMFLVKNKNKTFTLASYYENNFTSKINFDSNFKFSKIEKIGNAYWLVANKKKKSEIYVNQGNGFNKILDIDAQCNILDKTNATFEFLSSTTRLKVQIKPNGQVKELKQTSIPASAKGKLHFAPNGDVFHFNIDKNKSKKFTSLYKNGSKYKGFIALNDFDSFNFVKTTNSPVLTGNYRNQGKDIYTLEIGNKVYKANSQFYILGIAETANKVFSCNKVKNKYQVQLNGNSLYPKKFNSIDNFCINKDASKIAFKTFMNKTYYNINKLKNSVLDHFAEHKLVVNGTIKKGKYGTPVYSKKFNSIIVIAQEGKSLYIRDL